MSAARDLSLRCTQNFLTDPALIDCLLDASTIGPDDQVYEIGPGTGSITERLLRRCRRVIAVEKDPALVRRLTERFAGCPRLTLRQGDALTALLPAAPYKVFASLPFNRTAAIVSRLTHAAPPPEDQYLVVQHEAALRFCGRPATTLYALLLAPWFEAGIIHRFRRSDFAPRPGVDVVLLRLAKRGPPLLPAAQAQRYRDFVTFAFTCRQPSLAETLHRLEPGRWPRRALADTGIGPNARPGEVPVERWLCLFEAFRRGAGTLAHDRVQGAEARQRRQQTRLHKQHRTRGRATGPGPPRRRNSGWPAADRLDCHINSSSRFSAAFHLDRAGELLAKQTRTPERRTA
ncbi:MAG TPA: rRNA adenine N(6)-methyltransferase family protein [Dehalococcoidia bacterium]|nr:rRNA adenine N(6)-methyltransferase family protein [Dehalococcoidia bacterium]